MTYALIDAARDAVVVATPRGYCALGLSHPEDRPPAFVMLSPATGRHYLALAETDEERLRAHWAGFLVENGVPEGLVRGAAA